MRIQYKSNKSSAWSVDDDVRILRHYGRPIFYLDRSVGSTSFLSIDDANDLAQYIAFLLNEDCATPEQGEIITITKLNP